MVTRFLAAFLILSATSASPPDEQLVFHSDFSTARGTSPAALLDSNKQVPWDALGGRGRLNEVVAAEGLDFPSENVLAVVAGYREGGGAASQSHRLRFENQHIPIPQVGQSLYYRWYMRVMIPDSYRADIATHPIQDAVSGSGTNWLLRIQSNADGTFNARYDVDASRGNRANRHFGSHIVLRKGVTYRYELQLHRVSSTTFNLHARIYDAKDRLLYDDHHFRNANRSQSLANRPSLWFNKIEHLAGFQIGFNGLNKGAADLFPFVLYYQGAVCIRRDRWCGAYRDGV
jgi:hypothetical protein